MQGISAREALAGIGFLGTDIAPKLPAAYVELHVECGSQLEARKKSLGVFTRWWGAHKVDLTFEGKTAHTGPTPMRERQDSLYAAAQVIVAMRALGAVAVDSLAGHDAIMMAAVCPTVMLTVPSRTGLCHHPDEWTSQEDLGKGMAWLSADALGGRADPGVCVDPPLLASTTVNGAL